MVKVLLNLQKTEQGFIKNKKGDVKKAQTV